MRSSSGSVGGPITAELSNGGGKSIGLTAGISLTPSGRWADVWGAEAPRGASARLLRLDRLGQLGEDLVQIPDHAEIRELEDRRVLVLVDREDVLRALHPNLVLDRAGDAGRQVKLRRDRLAGLADLGRVRVPAGVDHGAGRRDGA